MQLEFPNLPKGAIVRLVSDNLGTIEGVAVPTGIVKQRQHIELAANVSLTVAQGVQTLLSLQVTTQSPTSRLMIWFTGCASSAIAGADIFFFIFVDGVEFQSSNFITTSSNIGACVAIVDDGPAAFTMTQHTIEVRWQTLFQTAQIRPTNQSEHASLSIIETIT